jgi:Ser/Thr protein kinase RdoA (MazF antagonist)
VTTTAYADLGDEEQAEALRPVALEAAGAFGLQPHRLQMVTHSYNTTFSLITPEGGRWALRVNTSSTSTVEEVLAQQAWQLAIASGTPVRVPVPLRTATGEWCALVASEALGRQVLVTCASWLEGPDVGRPSPDVAHAVGRAMAHLHAHARRWRLPGGSTMPVFDEPLFGDPVRFATAPGLTDEQRGVLARAHETMTEAFARVHAAGPVIPLHADLHGANLKWHDGRLAVFDFDDCGLGAPALDLAVSTFYLRGGDDDAEQAMRSGYAEVAPLPEVVPADFEALVAARQLLLGNDLLGSTTATWRSQASDYLVRTVDRLRHWLASGRFTPGPEDVG